MRIIGGVLGRIQESCEDRVIDPRYRSLVFTTPAEGTSESIERTASLLGKGHQPFEWRDSGSNSDGQCRRKVNSRLEREGGLGIAGQAGLSCTVLSHQGG